MYPYAPHAYDAAYALAYAVNFTLTQSNGDKAAINGDMIHNVLMNNVSFNGATGYVKFYAGMTAFQNYAMGDREEGHVFLLYNFNPDLYDATGGAEGFAQVGIWHLESGGVTMCTDANKGMLAYGTGSTCRTAVYYRTAGNVLPSDTPPDIYILMSIQMQGALFALGAILFVVSVVALGGLMYFWRTRMVRESHRGSMLFLVAGCVTGSVRVIVGGLAITNGSCIAQFWLGHVSFFMVFGSMLIKMWRLFHLANHKALTRSRVTLPFIFYMNCGIYAALLVYLIIATAVGKPHMYLIYSSIANQITYIPMCYNSPFESALFAIEAAILLYGMRVTQGVKGVPDSNGEKDYFTLGKTSRVTCFLDIVAYDMTDEYT
jgi:7 transmembrane sweet-taste receptor of 3 GCPR/Receptor family ligand binding region